MKVEKIELKGNDERGYVAEYFHNRSGQQLLVFSNAGSVRGRHYHKGLSETKNPEILILISGQIKIVCKKIGENEIKEQVVAAPARIEFQPFEWHELTAITACSFIEMNSLKEHIEDTFYDN